ncbi:hypothetical protein POTOM_032023 [Populus tomentosa]|uniref:Actin-related protein 9 n=1 Tax=Populus tomentosa TaxID=118781 RepID=A0A8X7Z7G2_POPTO|nr:hypothetical protein POTOM_032023 [Populus tomentosa]
MQEGLAAVFGNGLSTACIVNMGAQVTSVVCIEDGVALPNTEKTLPFGGEVSFSIFLTIVLANKGMVTCFRVLPKNMSSCHGDININSRKKQRGKDEDIRNGSQDISRCLLWTQRHHQTWPQVRTDMLTKPIDLLMLNRLKESYCGIKEGELDAVAVVHSYEDGMPAGSHKTRLTALNVPPMGLFYPTLLVPDIYPPPPRSWFHDYENMLEDTLHMEYSRRPDMSDGLFSGISVGYPMWESYPIFLLSQRKKRRLALLKLSLVAFFPLVRFICRIDLQRKLFCSIQLIGGVALTAGVIPAVEERLSLAIGKPVEQPLNGSCSEFYMQFPQMKAIDTVEIFDIAQLSWLLNRFYSQEQIQLLCPGKAEQLVMLASVEIDVLYAMCKLNYAGQTMFNEFGDNGGPAVTELIPKLAIFKKHLSSLLGVEILDIDPRHLVAGMIALKGLGGFLFVFSSPFGAYLLVRFSFPAERCPFWCIAFLHRDEEPDSKETAQEEDPQGESGLGISKKQTLKIGLLEDGNSFSARRRPRLQFSSHQSRHLLNLKTLRVTTAQHMEREKAYDTIASLLKIPFLDEEVANNSFPRKIGRADGYNPQSGKSVAFSGLMCTSRTQVPLWH